MMAGSVWLCWCQCHQVIRGDYNEARHWEDWATSTVASHDPLVNYIIPVDAKSPLEAAIACRWCIGGHVLALTDRPFEPPEHWTPQADGDEE